MDLYCIAKKWIHSALKPASRTHKLALRPCKVWPQGISGRTSSFSSFTPLWLFWPPCCSLSTLITAHSGLFSWPRIITHLSDSPSFSSFRSLLKCHSNRFPLTTSSEVLASITLQLPYLCHSLWSTCPSITYFSIYSLSHWEVWSMKAENFCYVYYVYLWESDW